MASTIYYGKSTTAANQANKIINTDLTFNILEEGDILSVYFSQRNDSNGISLVIPTGAGGSTNIIAYNNQNLPIEASAWGEGSIVNFIYICYDTVLNLYCWRIIAEHEATNTSYGSVLIDADDDSSAISLGKAKELITVASVGEISYTSEEFEEGIPIGILTLTSYIENFDEPVTQSVTIEIPKYAVLPSSLSNFENDMGYITNEIETDLTFIGNTKAINVSDDGNTITILELQDENGDLYLNSLNNIYLQPGQPDLESSGSVYIGSEIFPSDLNVTGTINTDYFIGESGRFNNILSANSAVFDSLEINTNGHAILRNATVDSLNVGEIPINDYVLNKLTTSLSTEAYRIFTSGAKNIIWKWHTSKAVNIAANDYNYKLYIGDFGMEGYRTIGVISWECFHQDGGTNPWLANLYGFYWDKSEVSGKYDALYAKVYNTSSSKQITKLRVTACVLLMRDTAWPQPDIEPEPEPEPVLSPETAGWSIQSSFYRDGDTNDLGGTLDEYGQLQFDLDNVCGNWNEMHDCPSLYVQDKFWPVNDFMRDIYDNLYEARDDLEVSKVVDIQDQDVHKIYELTCTRISDSSTGILKIICIE